MRLTIINSGNRMKKIIIFWVVFSFCFLALSYAQDTQGVARLIKKWIQNLHKATYLIVNTSRVKEAKEYLLENQYLISQLRAEEITDINAKNTIEALKEINLGYIDMANAFYETDVIIEETEDVLSKEITTEQEMEDFLYNARNFVDVLKNADALLSSAYEHIVRAEDMSNKTMLAKDLLYLCRQVKGFIKKSSRETNEAIMQMTKAIRRVEGFAERETADKEVIERKSTAFEQYRYVMDNYYNRISETRGEERRKLCTQAIEGFQIVIDDFDDPRAKTTKQLSAYYQAQCYRQLGDIDNYKKSLQVCKSFTPDIEEKDEDTYSYMMSLFLLADKELKILEENLR